MRHIPLAIIAALDDEIRLVSSKIAVDERIHVKPAMFMRGIYNKKEILLCCSGVGLEAMGNASQYMLKNFHPALCLHVGYCGAADPSLASGDLVIASAIVDSQNDQRFEPDAGLIDQAQQIIKRKGLRASTGAIATVLNFIPAPHEKAFIGTKHESIAIDMESSALASALSVAHIPYLVVRAVLDPLDHAIPDMGDSLDERGRTSGVAFAGHMIRHPSDMLKLPQLEYFASQARHSIAAFVEAWITEELT